MRAVAVTGFGKTAFGAFPDKSLRDLAVEAIQKCLADTSQEAASVDAFYLGNFAGPEFVGQSHLAPFVASAAGIHGVPCTRFENACASSGSAFYHAYAAVAAGLAERALVVGVEKMTSQSTPKVTEILAEAGDVGSEGKAGATFPALFAMIARRHMHQYGTTREHLASVAVKNHAYGALNPLAHMRKVITLEQALNGRPVADPLTVYDCSLVSDGAAAILLEPAGSAKGEVRVLGIAQASDHVALDRKPDITVLEANRRAAAKAFAMAGLAPRDVDVLEVHDCFTIAEIIAMEDLGFVPKGEGGPAVSSGQLPPVNTSGGLKSKGHPVGATGVGQICDLVIQLRGAAEAGRQVPNARIALAQNLGGSGATSVVTLLGAA
jgi:acetyl-CoA C-acetyltransferase